MNNKYKSMKLQNLLILLLILLLIYLFRIYISKQEEDRETFALNKPQNHKIILLGDSIFKNNIYVPENKSVSALLKKEYGKNNVLVLAMDGATIKEMTRQIDIIYPHQKYNNKNTYIFVSFGGNDIIDNFILNKTHVSLEELFQRYKSNMTYLKNKVPKANICLTTVYYPQQESYNREKLIKKWNNKIIYYAKINNYLILNLHEHLLDKTDFTNKIEPSVKGGKIIVSQINKIINQNQIINQN